MTYSDEKLSAYLDGELSVEDAEELRRALVREAALKVRLENLIRTDESVRRAYAAIDDLPMPAPVLKLLGVEEDAADADDGANVTRLRAMPPAPRAPAWSLPLAASVALLAGVGLGAAMFSPGPKGVRVAGVIDQSDPLYAALETGRSAAATTVDGAQVTPLLTFRTTDGDYCREFVSRDAKSGVRSVACREESNWRIEIAVADAPLASDEFYVPAAGAGAAIDSFVERAIDGDPLGRDEEARLIGNGWKP